MEVNKIYNGDCLELMKGIPDGSIDLIVTDPPYGINYQSARRTDKDKRFKKIKNDKKPFIWFLYDSYKVLKENSCILCFCRWDTQECFKLALEWAGFKVKALIVWDREHHGMGDLKGSPSPCHDSILFAVKGDYVLPGKRPKNIIKSKRLSGEQLTHPNEKPVSLIEDLINSYSGEDFTILDPFIGSGTTAIACFNTKRNYIGIEKDSKYFEIAQRRINEHTINNSMLV